MTQQKPKVNKVPESELWLEYERRKRMLEKLDIDHAEYERRVRAIAKELGL